MKNITQEAKKLLKSKDILEKITQDMECLGYVGESENKALGYLIALSRKLTESLSGIVISSSGAGKSKLIDTIQRLTPLEDIVFASRLSAQSLYYMPKDSLKHKLLIVEEREGRELADYAIRTLQSKGILKLAIPVKNQTVFFSVSGPVSILETTAKYKLNLENSSRCFILHLDESEKQTRLIHSYQRMMRTAKGFELKMKQKEIIDLHHIIQRLIKPYQVVIPYAKSLSFDSSSAQSRREQAKFLTLIEVVTLLNQYKRKKITIEGILAVESTIDDYKIAYQLFKHASNSSLCLKSSTLSFLLSKIKSLKNAKFSRLDIAKHTGWPHYKVRDNIRYLEKAGLVKIIKKEKGRATLYRLNSHISLTKPEELEENISSTT